MIRRMTALLLTLALCAFCASALGADNGADPLSWVELQEWAEGLLEMSEGMEPYNDPSDPASYTDDGYAFVYDFGTLYFSQPNRDSGSVLQAAVVYDDAVAAPRGTNTLFTLQRLLDSYYNENPHLDGSREEACLYLGGTLSDGIWWGMVQRDGQWVDTVQYAVHMPLEDGRYTDAGLVYTLQQNTVVAVRAYGLQRRVTADEVSSETESIEAASRLSGYTLVPSSADGASLSPFEEDDLHFAGIDFLTCTPEEALEVLGAPDFEDAPEDGGEALFVLGYEDCELVFLTGADGSRTLRSFSITGGTLEGPRALRVGDSLTLATQRFRFGEGGLEGNVETLYGTPGRGNWATAEYGDNADAILRYGLTLADGRQVVLMVTIEMFDVTDVTVYIP